MNSIESKIIPIMHCFDNNYVIPAAVSFYSMLENANKEYYYKLYVLHSDITIQNQKKLSSLVNKFSNATLEFISMENRFNDIWGDLKFSGHYSKEVLYKLLVPSIFPQYDKIIITDVDVVFLGDISPSYFVISEEDNEYFAGVHQIMPKGTWLESYYQNYVENFGEDSLKELKICGGYIVANLKTLRKDNKEVEFLKYLKMNMFRLIQAEQDVINFCCSYDKVKYLDLNYVVCTYEYEIFNESAKLDIDEYYSAEQIVNSMEKPIQLHYATGIKPWNVSTCTKADVWYSYLTKTEMFFDFMQRKSALDTEEPEFIDNSVIRKESKENNSPIMVSVLCCTHNHEKFIRKTLEGILNQKVDFYYEIIVADDCSTDTTQEIIKEFYELYPEKIKPILRQKNVGIGNNYYDALCHIEGKYMAICDGDDNWIDDLKLKKQVDFLQEHPDYNICCGACYKYNWDTGEKVLYEPIEYIKSAIQEKDYYTFKDLLYCRFIASTTVMFRWQLRKHVPEFLKSYKVIDYPLELLHAAGGKIKVMNDEIFSQYNLHGGGITSTDNSSVEQEAARAINEVNQYLDYKFSKIVLNYFCDLKQYLQWKQKYDNDPYNSKCEEVDGSVVESVQTKQKTKRRFEFAHCIYDECMPELFKRIWRILKKFCKLLYRELVPNIVKRAIRKVRRR